MQISRVRFQNYRNIEFADLEFKGQFQAFVGLNGQGKSNLLEGLGLLSALRSFRTSDANTLIKQGNREAQIIIDLVDEQFGETSVELKLLKKGKEVHVDGEKLSRFRDFIGRFPVVVLSSHDIQLLRGAPGLRRQWFNRALSAASRENYDILKSYHRLLADRNALLKSNSSTAELKTFEKLLAEQAANLVVLRSSVLPEIQELFQESYQQISTEDESPELIYRPESNLHTPEEFIQLFESNREKDLILKTTLKGPHRDDLEFRLQSRKAKEYASEGQQRGLILSLELAHLKYLHKHTGIQPVLLADDILGELDPERKKRFWSAIGNGIQVIATGTEIPGNHSDLDWQVFQVEEGGFRLL